MAFSIIEVGSFEVNWKVRFFKLLCIVDQLAQLAIFENLLESNYTTLPKDNVFLITFCTRVQIYKNS
jgi:hypothetical protein